MTFKKSLWATLLVIGVVPIICIGLICTLITVDNVREKGEQVLLSAADTSGFCFENYWDAQKRGVYLLSNTKRIQECLKESAENTISDEVLQDSSNSLESWVESNPGYLNAFLINEKGIVISCFDGEHLGYDFSQQSFFTNTINSDDLYVSDVLKSSFNVNQDVIRICSRVEYKEYAGVVVFEVLLSFFDSVLEKNILGNTGISYIVDANNQIISYTDNVADISDIHNDILISLLQDYKADKIKKSDVLTYEYENQESIMSYYVIDDLEWIFVTTQLVSDIDEPVHIFLTTIFVVLVVAIVITVIACAFLTRFYMQPIRKLQTVFHEAAQENRYVPCEIVGKNEFSELADGYNIMIKKLNDNHNKLDDLYQEVSAQEEEIRQNYLLLGEEHQKIEQLALSDFLTGLYNRTSFEQQLRMYISEKLYFGLLFFDLDGFKEVNDLYGHIFGDLCLLEVAKRLTDPDLNLDVISRVGGDEFFIIKVAQRQELKELTEKINKIMKEPFHINEHSLHMTASIGIAVFPEDGADYVSIMKNADLALYHSKELGKCQTSFFAEEMVEKLKRQTDVLHVVQNAIDTEEVFAVYQAEVSVKDGSIVGFETLMRLVSKKLGFISPIEFIPITESSGDIISLGRWIMIKACLFAKKLLDAGKKINVISVNVSLVQLEDINFVQTVLDVLKNTELPPQYLQIEITESVLMANSDSNVEKLNQLRSYGITIALDDFGTGYSAMSYLFELPIDVLKIDKSFIDDITSNPNKQAICCSIIEMAHTLDMKVIAEGIELEDQRVMLEEMDCDMIQGYLYSRPVNENDAFNLFDKLNS